MELSDRNVLAAFRDLEGAQQAIANLTDAGVPEERISVLGQRLSEIDQPEAGDEPSPKDGNVPANTLAGVTVGSLGGGALGLAGTALVALIPGVNIVGVGLLAGAAAGAGLGGTVGGIVEGEAAMRTDHSWGQAVEAVKSGAVVVGVHGADQEERGLEVLSSQNPQALHVSDARGAVVEDHTADDQPGPEAGDPEAAYETDDDVAQKDQTAQEPFESRNA